MNKYILDFNAATSVGSREKNQDVLFANGFMSSPCVTEEQSFDGTCGTDGVLRVFAVCDGVGMYEDSGPAAEAALQRVKELTDAFTPEEEITIEFLEKWVQNALVSARDALFEFCKKNHTNGSATIVILAIINDIFVEANIGDSPAFLLRDGEIEELTMRHNMANLKRLMGAVPVEGEERILLHHLGENRLTFDEKCGNIKANNTFLICSDGVTNAFDADDVKNHLNAEKNASFFVSAAGKEPSADNCTAIIVSVKGVELAEGQEAVPAEEVAAAEVSEQ